MSWSAIGAKAFAAISLLHCCRRMLWPLGPLFFFVICPTRACIGLFQSRQPREQAAQLAAVFPPPDCLNLALCTWQECALSLSLWRILLAARGCESSPR
ncbi:hypothetical protein B0H63DRAFT_464612 [Podospora didyma]|uniref:Uncharacterized protein n=1 Tax=Podospora didyma TaxID=330526 RepID=A0AAE0NYG4_9PEZI|nr:hypothetical protein B0H63DRAFT_464612 [Podospora didyma]